MVDVTWDRIPDAYDRVAERYEAQFLDELAAKPFDRALLDRFGDSVDGPVADVGCGPGQVGAYLRSPGRPIVGVDVSPAMAERAATRLDVAVVADLRYLPIADGSLGGLVAFYSLIHVPRHEIGDALIGFRRALRAGGRLLLSAHEGTGLIEQDEFLGTRAPFVATCFSLDELASAARRAGLVVTAAERRPPYPAEHPTVRLYVEAVRPTSRDRTGSSHRATPSAG